MKSSLVQLSSTRTIFCLLLLGAVALPTILRAQTTGTITALYQFTGGADGGQPVGGVVRDTNGTLYGETSTGGAAVCSSKVGMPSLGCGTIYSFSPASGLKVLADFVGLNGAHGQSTLTLVGTTLYGSTYSGGSNDLGTLFSIQTDGSQFKVLHQFSGSDGEYPGPQLRVGPNGIFYGVTPFGGAHGDGVFFSLTSNGIFTDLHDFAGGIDGNQPFTLLATPSGVLVGSTFLGGGQNKYCLSGCGTVFEYNPRNRQYVVPYSYTNSGGAGGVLGTIRPDGTVYGADTAGVYSLNGATGYTDLGDADVLQEGVADSGPLLAPDGSLLGVNGPGPNQTGGTLYSAAGGILTTLQFFGGAVGGYPFSQPIMLSGKRLIGTATMYGLCTACGTIWTYTP